jgi:hypothetical protein
MPHQVNETLENNIFFRGVDILLVLIYKDVFIFEVKFLSIFKVI